VQGLAFFRKLGYTAVEGCQKAMSWTEYATGTCGVEQFKAL